MKATIAFIALFTMTSAFAANTLPSIKECNISRLLGKYTVEGTRITGKEAHTQMSILRKLGARSVKTVDDLDIVSYETLTLRSVLETNGGDAYSCQGEIQAIQVNICGVANGVAACEVRCEVKWTGPDCR